MTRRYLVEGTVQGVGFRWFVLRSARRLGLRGWVRNLPGGQVEALAAGAIDALARFGEELSRGPAGASVTNVQIREIPDEAETPIAFEIRT